MKKNKISNYLIIMTTIMGIVIVFLVSALIKINDNHNKKLIYSMEENIKYYANRCYLEEKCSKKTTLKELYENNYMKEVVNPITKEIANPNTKVEYKDGNWKVIWIDEN